MDSLRRPRLQSKTTEATSGNRPRLPTEAAANDEGQDARIIAALSNRSKVERMLRHMRFEDEQIENILDRKATFPIPGGFGVVRRSEQTNKYRCFLYPFKQKGKRKPKPVWAHLGELLAIRLHGAKWRGNPQRGDLHSARLPRAVRNYFLWRLISLSRVVPIKSAPLPRIPDMVLYNLQSEAEVTYAVNLVTEFGLMRDLLREFQPRVFAASLAGTFSQSFRALLFAEEIHQGLVDQIEAEARARRKAAKVKPKYTQAARTDQIWKMLAPRTDDDKDGVILRVVTKFATHYRFGFAERTMQDGYALLDDAMRRWQKWQRTNAGNKQA